MRRRHPSETFFSSSPTAHLSVRSSVRRETAGRHALPPIARPPASHHRHERAHEARTERVIEDVTHVGGRRHARRVRVHVVSATPRLADATDGERSTRCVVGDGDEVFV